MALKYLHCGAFANESERHAAEYLKTRLQNHVVKDDWYLLTNYSNSTNSRRLSDELDLVVLGRSGISVVEIKHWNDTNISLHHIAEAEAEKLNEKVKRLKGKLEKNCNFDIGFIEGKLLLTKDENKKYIDGFDRRSIRGIKVFGLKEWRDLLEVSARPSLTNDQIAYISRILHPQASALANEEIKNFNNTFIELRSVKSINTPFRRVYHARRKPGREKVLLHLYDLSASIEKNAIDIARREFEILQRLQKSIWLPDMMDSFQEAGNYPGELYFFSYTDTESPTLDERTKDVNWKKEDRIYTVFQSIKALRQIHCEGKLPGEPHHPILHRNLTPETIHVRSNNEPLLTQFHLAKITGSQTVAAAAPKSIAGLEAYTAPEVRESGIGVSSASSDIFSLCASLCVIFRNAPEECKSQQTDEILDVLEFGLEADPAKRASLEEIESYLSEIFDEPEPTRQIVPAVKYWDEDTIFELHGRNYRVITKLGQGGFGTTFKVNEVNPETNENLSGPYVAKVITNEVAGEEAARAYAKVRAQTGTAHLAGVLEVVSKWQPNSVTALLRWIKGDPLSDLTGVLTLHFDDFGNDESHEDMLLKWLFNLCEALAQLHDVDLVHGDVSPGNIIVDGNRVVLTDFDTATAVGTKPLGRSASFCSLELERDLPIEFSDDLYSLAATIFHVLFDRFPFNYGLTADKMRGLNWQDIDQNNWQRLYEFLNQATNPDRSQRFDNAMEASIFIGDLMKSKSTVGKLMLPEFQEESLSEQKIIVPEKSEIINRSEFSVLQTTETNKWSEKISVEKSRVDLLLSQRYISTTSDSPEILDIVNCANADFRRTVLSHNVYLCPAQGGAYKHKQCKYLGVYWEKHVGAVAEIKAVIDVHSERRAEKYFVNGNENIEDYIAEAIKKALELRPNHLPVRVFLLEKLHSTNFTKDSSGGMFGSKIYLNVEDLGASNAEDLAEKLYARKYSEFGL